MQYLEYKAITKYKFYQKTGISNGFLDKKGAIGSDKCEIIISYFPDLNPEWLLTGKGEMLKIGIVNDVGEPKVEYGADSKTKQLEKRLYESFLVNQDLQNEIKQLKEELNRYKVKGLMK